MDYNIDDVAKKIREVVDFNRLMNMVQYINKEPDINDRMNRSDKGKLVELGLDICSGGKIKRVNEIGFDHTMLFEETKCDPINLKFELKSGLATSMLYTQKGTPKKEFTSDIALMNTMGSNKERKLEKTFDYLIIIDLYSVGLIPFSVVSQHAVYTNDQLKAKIPISEVLILITPDDFKLKKTTIINSYMETKEQSMLDFLNQL